MRLVEFPGYDIRNIRIGLTYVPNNIKDWQVCAYNVGPFTGGQTFTFRCERARNVNYVIVRQDAHATFGLCEIEVFGPKGKNLFTKLNIYLLFTFRYTSVVTTPSYV